MITKNSPATLYLLNPKNPSKIQQQKKSARLSFNKKKSSRSISHYQKQYQKQYKKWNPNKQTITPPFQPSNRSSSDIKRIMLSKNQFGLQNMPIQKKLSQIAQIFAYKKEKVRISYGMDQGNIRNRSNEKSGQMSLLSLKDDRNDNNRRCSHIRTQSMINNSQNENTIQQTILRIQRMFKIYEKGSQDWKLKYLYNQSDNLLDSIIKGFKSLFNEIIKQLKQTIINNVQYFQKSIINVSRQYQTQIFQLKQQIKNAQNIKNIVTNLFINLNQQHNKNIISTLVWQNIQLNGTNLQSYLKTSPLYEKIIKISAQRFNEKYNDQKILSQYQSALNINLQFQIKQQSNPKINKQKVFQKREYSENSQNYNQQHLDFVEQNNWDDKFRTNECIKGVLKYINNQNNSNLSNKNNCNYNNANYSNNNKNNYQDLINKNNCQDLINKNHNINKKQTDLKKNLNSTGGLQKNQDMKIQNWKSFQKNQKSIGKFKKILSQR